MTLIPNISELTLDQFLGFNQLKCVDGEAEHADCLCWIEGKESHLDAISEWFSAQANMKYKHHPNRLSREHVDWEIIDMVQKASRLNDSDNLETANYSSSAQSNLSSSFTAEAIIRKRRSAQNYDQQASQISLSDFMHALEKTLPTQACPFDLFPYEAKIHLAIFVHAVVGLESGLYMFVRNPEHLNSLKKLTRRSFDWHQVKENLPLYLLQTGNFRARAESISCTQAIAGESAYALGMLAHFDGVLMQAPSMYPRLFWETGLIGQVLYLEAEAQDLRATGIGCFFDDEMHNLLGLEGDEWQSLYHFTVGKQVDDARLETRPPYFHLEK